MNDAAAFTETAPAKTEHFDVLIVGAGISGIGGAYHLTKQCPGTSFVVLETQESFGGTWLTHRYPGIRSDSDLYTFGYRFKPWTRRADRDGRRDPELHGRGDRRERPRPAHPLPAPDRLGAAGRAATTSGRSRRTRTDTGETVRFTANFLWMCQGYYRHSEGYTPRMGGHGRLQGPDRPPADLAGGPRLHGQEGRRHRLGRHRGDAHPGDRGRLRPRHDAAALADLFQHRPQRDRARRRRCASCRSTRRGSTRSCAARSCTTRPSSPAARSTEPEAVKQELLGGGARLSRPRLRHRHALHAELPAVAAAHRLRSGRRPVPGHPRRQGIGRHRRDRAVHRDRHPAEVGQAARGRHHRHRDRLQSQRAGRHRLRHRRQAARSSPTRSPIAA